jgi:hypothetical protein
MILGKWGNIAFVQNVHKNRLLEVQKLLSGEEWSRWIYEGQKFTVSESLKFSITTKSSENGTRRNLNRPKRSLYAKDMLGQSLVKLGQRPSKKAKFWPSQKWSTMGFKLKSSSRAFQRRSFRKKRSSYEEVMTIWILEAKCNCDDVSMMSAYTVSSDVAKNVDMASTLSPSD